MMHEEPPIYEQIRATQATPEEVFRAAQSTNRGNIQCLVVLRAVFGLSLREAVEVLSDVENAPRALSEREAEMLPLITQALDRAIER